ncbi:3-hydroxyacyl-CoA dehydrogenase family protein [Calderihabitans maritimus]|uniref:3-hydroxybutyryl-CoA dehydrogenase n=1 Tax=Calderihabitans maritimus TaxID=1246530 RepID=A0A1Z5HSW3_9FIRM|nr:3-hydroxyacyl-CoA dehydrogenase family protein [Calderihabitans maritimus]GAW92626.1 3-hydroxybutyryl-CoA dehydrogenase [Calderihabitans maritimus]
MEINRVMIVGAGTMGTGIAQVVAEAGYQVLLSDISEEVLSKSLERIEAFLERKVEKGKISRSDKEKILGRIHTSTGLDRTSCGEMELIIEAVPEDLKLKQNIFQQLDDYTSASTILASNTSSLSITAIASVTQRPSRVLGLHFMNPVPLMQGVEVIGGRLTSEETLSIGKKFVESLGKTPVVAVDYPGFIVSRILDVMLNEAVHCVMDGNSPEEIDKAMKVCTNFPMGPLELIDLAGADILLNVMEAMQREMGEKYRPAPLLRQMVRAGQLGKKTGQGFYRYDQGGKKQ